MKILFKNPLVLTMTNGEKLEKKDVLIVDSKIAEIKENISTNDVDKVIDASNCVLMPGFKNAHAHAPMTFSRSSSDNLSLQDWLSKCIFPMEDQIKPGDVYNLTKGAILEYLTSGITASYEMYYAPFEIASACKDMGFKSVILGTTTSGRQSIAELEDAYLKINGEKNDLVSYRLGFHAEYTIDDIKLSGLIDLKNKYKTPISTHSSETMCEVNGCKERRDGLTPIEFLDKNGLLDYGGTIFHGVALSDNDMKIIKNRKVFVVSCPGSNGKLASGTAPISELMEHKIPVALGTDGAGSNNCLDFFKEMSLLYNFQKIRNNNPIGTSAFEILKMATVNGAHAMGLYNADTIEVGKSADIILIDLDRPNMQPINNIITNIVYSGSKDNIKLTMIDGKILYWDRKFYLDEDYHEIYKTQQEISDRLNSTNLYK